MIATNATTASLPAAEVIRQKFVQRHLVNQLVNLLRWCDDNGVLLHDALETAEEKFLEQIDRQSWAPEPSEI